MTRRGSAAGRAACALALAGLVLLLLCCPKPAAAAASPHASSDSRSISRPTIQPDVAHAGSSWWQQDPPTSPPRHKQQTIAHPAGQPCDQTLFSFVASSTQQHSFVRRLAGASLHVSFFARLSSSSRSTRTQQAAGRWEASGGATSTAPCPDHTTHPISEPWPTPQQLDQRPPPLGTHPPSTSCHQQQQQQQQQQRPVAAARRLLWGRRLRQLDLKLLQGSSAAQEVQKDIIRLQQIQGGDANLRLSYVQNGLYYLLTCGGFNGGQDVAAAAAAYRALPGSNPQYAAAGSGMVQLRLQLLEEILPRATRAGRRNVEECDWYYNTLAPDVSPAFTLQGLSLNSSTAPAPQNASASPSPAIITQGSSPAPAASPAPLASSPSPLVASPSPNPSPSQQAAYSRSPSPSPSPSPSQQASSPSPSPTASPSPSGPGSGSGGGQGEEAGAAPGFFWNGSKWVPVSSGLPPPGGVVMGVPSGGMPAVGGSSGSVVVGR